MIDPNFWGVLYFMVGIGAFFMMGSMLLFVASLGLFIRALNKEKENGQKQKGE